MKKQVLFTICAVVAIAALQGCSSGNDYVTKSADISETFPIEAKDAGENPQMAESDGPYAIFHTTAGDITAILYPEQAPEMTAYFISLAEQGYYNGSSFDYIDKDNTIQAGAIETNEELSAADKSPANEYNDGLHHFPGALAMTGGKTDAEKSKL